MADPLISSVQDNKLSTLNKQIVEIKKKIQLSEGRRKANFEECDAKKRENAERIVHLKKEVKELQIDLSKAKNITSTNDDATDQISRESSARTKKRSLNEANYKVNEDNVRLRKKLDLVRYQSDKQQNKLTALLREYEELTNGTIRRSAERKLENPLKKKIVHLENYLHRMSVMQMEVDMVRKTYRSVRSNLKADATFYVSSLTNLEENIGEQESEIKRLQEVKKEAIELRNITKETLTKKEIEAINANKERDRVILDYRQRVEDRKLELERLERMIFPSTRQLPRDDFDAEGHARTVPDSFGSGDASKNKVARLEESFAKLRSATGVTRNEDVLNRFLGQRATRERLQKMRTVTEEEKMSVEKKRQQLLAEIEMQKFSETKDADQNAEELDKFNCQIFKQRQREEKARAQSLRIRELLNEVTQALWRFCDKLRDASWTSVPEDPLKIEDPFELLRLLVEKMNVIVASTGGTEIHVETSKEFLTDKLEMMSIAATSTYSKIEDESRTLFPRFPAATTPAMAAPASEDEEEIPTRNVLKRQAQFLVDTKSRRKGFNLRR